MKKKLLAALTTSAALALGTVSGPASAGLKIDPTGLGSSSIIVTNAADNIASSVGDMLLDNLITSLRVNSGTITTMAAGSGTVFAHNVIALDVGVPGEITFVMQMAATSSGSYASTSTFGNASMTLANPTGTPGTDYTSFFGLYYDPLETDVTKVKAFGASGVAANHDTGAGYDDGVLLGSGVVTIRQNPVTFASEFDVTSDLSIANSRLDQEFTPGDAACDGTTGTDGCTLSAKIGGSQFLSIDIDFTTLDTTGFLVNDISKATIDISIESTAGAPYNSTLPPSQGGAVARASDVVGGSSGGTLYAGIDGVNDLFCGQSVAAGTDTACDLQYQINTTMTIRGAVPEPGTLALLGIGFFGLAGFSRRKRNKVA